MDLPICPAQRPNGVEVGPNEPIAARLDVPNVSRLCVIVPAEVHKFGKQVSADHEVAIETDAPIGARVPSPNPTEIADSPYFAVALGAPYVTITHAPSLYDSMYKSPIGFSLGSVSLGEFEVSDGSCALILVFRVRGNERGDLNAGDHSLGLSGRP